MAYEKEKAKGKKPEPKVPFKQGMKPKKSKKK